MQQPGNFNHNTSEGPNSHEWKTGSVNNIFDKWTSKSRFYELPAARFSQNNLKFLFKIKNIWRIYNRCQDVKNINFFEENLKLFKMLSKLLKLLMNFKKVQNQTSNEATINQKVNGNLKRKRRKHSNLWPSRCAAGKNEWAWADFFSSSILIIQHLKRAYAALKVQGYAFWSHKDIEWFLMVFSNCFH